MGSIEQFAITKNLPVLINMTTCNNTLLNTLYSQNVISREELDELLQERVPQMTASKLYRLLQNRPDAFNIFIRALEETCQLGVLRILDIPEDILQYDKFSPLEENQAHKLSTNFAQVHKGIFGTRPSHIKLYKRNIEEHVTLALKELEILSELDWHDSILRCLSARIVDLNSSSRLDYLAVALEDRMTLEDIFASNKILTVEETLSITGQLLGGVDFVHKKCYVHLNLTEKSVFIKQEHGRITLKIGDFQFAKRLKTTTSTAEVSFIELKDMNAGSFNTPELLTAWDSAAERRAQEVLPVQVGLSTDVFCLGDLIYFVRSNGTHLHGNGVCRQVSIMTKNIIATNQMEIAGFRNAETHAHFYHCFKLEPAERPTTQSLLHSFQADLQM